MYEFFSVRADIDACDLFSYVYEHLLGTHLQMTPKRFTMATIALCSASAFESYATLNE